MHECGYIPDGYTRPGYIKAEKGLYPALRFVFRPMAYYQRQDANRRIAGTTIEEAERIAAEAITKQIRSWDLQDHAGAAVLLSRAAVAKLHPALFARLYAIVAGMAPSDDDPEWATEDAREKN